VSSDDEENHMNALLYKIKIHKITKKNNNNINKEKAKD